MAFLCSGVRFCSFDMQLLILDLNFVTQSTLYLYLSLHIWKRWLPINKHFIKVISLLL